MMKLPRSISVVAIATGALLLAASTGAVAGSLVTSAQIKDNTIRSVDVKNGTLKLSDISAGAKTHLQGQTGAPGAPGTPGVSGRVLVTADSSIGANGSGYTGVDCPAGTVVLGGGGEFLSSNQGVQVRLENARVYALGKNDLGSAQTLRAYAICANVS